MQIFLIIKLRKNIWEIFAHRRAARIKKLFSTFFLSRSKLQNKYKIIFLCDQPFMFFLNKSTNYDKFDKKKYSEQSSGSFAPFKKSLNVF